MTDTPPEPARSDDPRLSELLTLGRTIWGEHPPLELQDAAIILTAVVGDIARTARTLAEGGCPCDECDQHSDARRELGNLILTAVRAADDLGLGLPDCIAAAEQAQRLYAARLRETP